MIDSEAYFNRLFHSFSFAVPQVNGEVDELAVLANQFFQRGLVQKLLCLFLHEQAKRTVYNKMSKEKTFEGQPDGGSTQ